MRLASCSSSIASTLTPASPYSSLSTLRLVQKDQALKAGEILGAVGTCPAEESLGEHLHLEWYVDSEAVDPTTFLEQ